MRRASIATGGQLVERRGRTWASTTVFLGRACCPTTLRLGASSTETEAMCAGTGSIRRLGKRKGACVVVCRCRRRSFAKISWVDERGGGGALERATASMFGVWGEAATSSQTAYCVFVYVKLEAPRGIHSTKGSSRMWRHHLVLVEGRRVNSHCDKSRARSTKSGVSNFTEERMRD